MSTGFSGPLLYSRRGKGGQPAALNGIPLEVADQAFNRQFVSKVIGNGRWDGPAAGGAANGWTVTDIGAATWALDNAGQLVATTNTTDEDKTQAQLLTLPFRYSATNRLWCFARIALSTAITTDALFGLCISDTILLTAAAGAVDMTDGIFFYKLATATDYTFHVRKNSTSTTQAMGITLTDAAFAIIGFTVIGGVIQAYAALDPNDSIRHSPRILGNPITVANTNAPDDENVFLSLVVGQEGGTTARTATVDWAFAVSAHT